MTQLSMSNFCKNEDCPTSQELLEYQVGDLPLDRSIAVGAHLSSCEFCSAEVDFYSHYPQNREEEIQIPTATEIPAPLFELAEALLKIRSSDPSSLDSLLRDSGSLMVD
ncbi:MAG: hypothetical protein KA746_09615 [Pyrinomonadaceae bacterium]|nr:hypothetical protein [Pyrinomonadaceae bacterium]MBP6212706.1 hypothetical protein [Pyrinomonadaceae bacterium]